MNGDVDGGSHRCGRLGCLDGHLTHIQLHRERKAVDVIRPLSPPLASLWRYVLLTLPSASRAPPIGLGGHQHPQSDSVALW